MMNLSQYLDKAFSEMISGSSPSELLKEIRENVSPDDADTLMEKVNSLGDPGDYCKNAYDGKTVAGFFLFIDFVSALLIHMGNSATERLDKYSDSRHPFVKWVVKYTKDDRFHPELTAKFNDVFKK